MGSFQLLPVPPDFDDLAWVAQHLMVEINDFRRLGVGGPINVEKTTIF